MDGGRIETKWETWGRRSRCRGSQDDQHRTRGGVKEVREIKTAVLTKSCKGMPGELLWCPGDGTMRTRGDRIARTWTSVKIRGACLGAKQVEGFPVWASKPGAWFSGFATKPGARLVASWATWHHRGEGFESKEWREGVTAVGSTRSEMDGYALGV